MDPRWAGSLILSEGRSLLQIRTGTETGVDLAGYDEGTCGGFAALVMDVIDVPDEL